MKILILTLILIGQSYARPILSKGIGVRVNDLLTLYPDHQNRNLFYYFADSSEISFDQHGYPKFSLVYDQDGGFVHGAFKLSLSKKLKDALNQFKLNNPSAKITHMPIIDNSLEAGLESKNSKLFENFSHANYGAPIGGETGFSAELSSRGAKLFANSLKGSNPFSLNQCITVSGLSDNLDAHISINWEESLKEIKASFKGKVWIIGLDIKGIVKRLMKKGAIKITINGGDEDDQAYIRKMADELVKEFLTPVTDIVDNSKAEKSKSFLGMKFKMKYQDYKVKTSIDFYVNERINIEKKHCLMLGMESIQDNYEKLVNYVEVN